MNIVEAKRTLRNSLLGKLGAEGVSIAKLGRAAITLGTEGQQFKVPVTSKERTHEIIRFLMTEVERRIAEKRPYTDHVLGALAVLQVTDKVTRNTLEKIFAQILLNEGLDENFRIKSVFRHRHQVDLVRQSVNEGRIREGIRDLALGAQRNAGARQRNRKENGEFVLEVQQRAKERGNAYRRDVRRRQERERTLSAIRAQECGVAIVAPQNIEAVSPGGLRLDEEDIKLICRWANVDTVASLSEVSRSIPAYEASRLASARLAEKAMIGFYEKNGAHVEDVSILQLSENDSRWQMFDLVVDGRPIDVKNCRQSVSLEKGYSEIFVPEFKRSRSLNQDVTIAGVLSEYKSVEWLENNSSSVQILGESSILHLQSAFDLSSSFFDVPIEFSFSARDSRLPFWCFDYANHRERNENAVERLEQITAILQQHDEIRSTYRLPQTVLFRLRCLGVESGFEPEAEWQVHDDLVRRAADFLNKVQSYSNVTRTHVYLMVLGLTLEGLLQRSKSWNPGDITKLLFIDDGDAGRPLGLYDPLEYIRSFVDALDALWIEGRTKGIRFESFRMVNPWILVGSDASSERWSLVAYCGGRKEIERAGSSFETSCGYSPLIFGKHQTCRVCRKLICPECNHCTYGCSRMGSKEAAEVFGEFDYPEDYFQ